MAIYPHSIHHDNAPPKKKAMRPTKRSMHLVDLIIATKRSSGLVFFLNQPLGTIAFHKYFEFASSFLYRL